MGSTSKGPGSMFVNSSLAFFNLSFMNIKCDVSRGPSMPPFWLRFEDQNSSNNFRSVRSSCSIWSPLSCALDATHAPRSIAPNIPQLLSAPTSHTALYFGRYLWRLSFFLQKTRHPLTLPNPQVAICLIKIVGLQNIKQYLMPS